MMGTVRALALAGVSAAVLAASAGGAAAGAFGVREQSAEAQGMSFAGAASGSGSLSSMFWNPAVITMRPGINQEINGALVAPQSRITPQAGTLPLALGLGPSGDIAQSAVVPATYSSYQLSDRLWIGMSSGAAFGFTTKPRDVYAGQVYGRSSRIFSLNFNPIIGYKVNDWLSVAVGPQIEFFKIKLKQALSLSPLAPTGFLKGDSFGYGYTAGVTITPFAGTVIGAGYRSSINHNIVGNGLGIPGVDARASLNTPEKISFGITQAINPVFRVNFQFEFDNWSRVKQPAIVAELLALPVSSLPLKFKDGFYYAIGAEYDLSPTWTVRGGVGYEKSPIDDTNRGTRIPDSDRYSVSVGAGYRYSEKIEFNAAYTHLFLDKGRINLSPGNPAYLGYPLLASVESSADLFSVGLKYRWDAPAPVAAVIRKY